MAIEPDLSNAVPFLAAALATGGEVTVAGWPRDSLQPAGRIIDLLASMGARVRHTPQGLLVSGSGQIRGVGADLSEVGELTPVLTALAALASSPSEFTGIGHVRRHETDRLAALAGEIGKLGGDVTELPDGLRIRPAPLHGRGVGVRQPRRPPAGDGRCRARAGRPAACGFATPRRSARPSPTSARPGRGCWRPPGEPGRPLMSTRPRHSGLDEDDVRVRAGRGSRPRTRRRPAHAEAVEAFVAGVDRGRYRCVIGDEIVTAMKARELGRGNIVVGDTGQPGRRRVRCRRARWRGSSGSRPRAQRAAPLGR